MKAILFDLDDTLYPYSPCHEEGLSRVLDFFKKEWNFTQGSELYNKAREWVQKQLKSTAASHHRLLYMFKLCELIKKNPIRYAQYLENLYWNGYFSKMRLYDGVKELLTLLKEKNFPLALVTDLTTEIQFRKLNFLSLTDFFDAIVTSEEAGVEKPSPIIFQLALEKLNIQSSKEVVMVGDSYIKDILGANDLGIKAYWLNGDQNKSNDMIVSFASMGELKNLLC